MSKEQVREPRAAYVAASEEAGEGITVAEMTALQLKMLIRSTLKETLQEVLGDPDAGLELRPEFEDRLRHAVAYATSDGHLLSMKELTDELEGAGGV